MTLPATRTRPLIWFETHITAGKNMVAHELDFAHDYDIRECPEVPGTGPMKVPVYYFPTPSGRPEHDGLWVEVHPPGHSPWLGVFGYGEPGISKVLSTPDSERVCVISGGRGYIVRAGNPADWANIPILPITDARPVPECGFILFADFGRLAAWGKSGIVWETQLGFDGLHITTVNCDVIKGYGYDPASAGDVPFSVNARTGGAKAGAITAGY